MTVRSSMLKGWWDSLAANERWIAGFLLAFESILTSILAFILSLFCVSFQTADSFPEITYYCCQTPCWHLRLKVWQRDRCVTGLTSSHQRGVSHSFHLLLFPFRNWWLKIWTSWYRWRTTLIILSKWPVLKRGWQVRSGEEDMWRKGTGDEQRGVEKGRSDKGI